MPPADGFTSCPAMLCVSLLFRVHELQTTIATAAAFFFFLIPFFGGRSVKNYHKWRFIPVVGKILYAGICGRKNNRCGLQRGPVFMGRSIYSTTLSTKWGKIRYIQIKKSLSCTVIIIRISRSIERYRISCSKCTDVDFSVVHYWNALLCVMCFYWRQPLHLV